MNLALDDCECGHVALVHYYDPTNERLTKCSDCDCESFEKVVDLNQGPYDHVPN